MSMMIPATPWSADSGQEGSQTSSPEKCKEPQQRSSWLPDRVLGFGFRVLGLGFWVLGFGFWVLGGASPMDLIGIL